MVWVVTPTSLFVLPGLFHWHLRERALDFGTESCSFFSPGSTQGCTVGAFRMCKGPKTCESLRPYKATVTLGPFASDHAPRQQNASKPTPSYPRPGERMEEGIGARINLWRIWSSFGGRGRCGGLVWWAWKIRKGHHTADLPTLHTHYQIPIP